MLKVAQLLCLAWLVLHGATATAQSAVPVEREPAHRLVLENPHLRVFEVWLPSGEDTLWHVHRHDGISVRLADATIEDQLPDGQSRVLQVRRGAVAYGATPTALTHRVRNVGETAFHNMYIELLADPGGGNGQAGTAPDRPVEFENDRVRAFRRNLAPGEQTDVHTHASSGIGVVVTAGSLESSGPQGATKSRDVAAGTVQWLDAGTTHALKNVGNAPIEIVDIEFK